MLTARRTAAPVEDLLTRNGLMLTCELTWLALFVTGLQAIGAMNIFPNEAGYQPRVLLLGGTSEIGLAILAALGAAGERRGHPGRAR